MDFGKKYQVPPPLDFQPVCIYDPSKQFYQFIAKKSNFPLIKLFKAKFRIFKTPIVLKYNMYVNSAC